MEMCHNKNHTRTVQILSLKSPYMTKHMSVMIYGYLLLLLYTCTSHSGVRCPKTEIISGKHFIAMKFCSDIHITFNMFDIKMGHIGPRFGKAPI